MKQITSLLWQNLLLASHPTQTKVLSMASKALDLVLSGLSYSVSYCFPFGSFQSSHMFFWLFFFFFRLANSCLHQYFAISLPSGWEVLSLSRYLHSWIPHLFQTQLNYLTRETFHNRQHYIGRLCLYLHSFLPLFTQFYFSPMYYHLTNSIL